MTPFLRWAGGKRWLAPRLAPILLSRLSATYYEPFLGSGALFFALAAEQAVLSDINDDLIKSYQIVMKYPQRVLDRLRSIPVDSKKYYQVRESEPSDKLARAVRFIYLNRTCYGGLHRTNRAGKFNTPFGGGSRTPEPLWRDGILYHAAGLLALGREARGIRLRDAYECGVRRRRRLLRSHLHDSNQRTVRSLQFAALWLERTGQVERCSLPRFWSGGIGRNQRHLLHRDSVPLSDGFPHRAGKEEVHRPKAKGRQSRS